MSEKFKNSIRAKFQDYTILVVDDNATNLKVIADCLSEYGFIILMARNGEGALKRARYVQPDIILLDVMMPDIDGFETCRRLKADEVTQAIPVIFMTALSDTADKVKGFEVGAVDYITKPIQNEEILARVTTHLNLRDLTRSLQEQNLHLEIIAQVGQQVTSILDLDELLVEVVKLIQSKFGYYFVGIWLLTANKEAVVLQSWAGSGGVRAPETGLSIPFDAAQSIMSWVCQTGQVYKTDDVESDPKYIPGQGLPGTRSEIALPLQIGRKMIGVLDIQSEKLAAFNDEDKTLLQALANQIAIAVRNAQLYKAEKKLRQVEEDRARDLAKLNAMKDKFFAIISYDLRTPFQALLGNAELLPQIADSASTSDIKKLGQRLYRLAKVASDLLDKLLQWSQLQRGTMPYKPERIDLKRLADQNMDLWQDMAAQKGINLVNAIESGAFAYADEPMIDTVIRNLISNALKFTPGGGEVKIWLTEGQENFVEVAVSDTGLGVSEKDLPKLFRLDIYYSTIGTAQEQGTGLGLIICQQMVARNGGKIWVQSKLGQGATVKFTIPGATQARQPGPSK